MELRTLAEALQFPEGPVALDDGSVLLVEIAGGTLTRVAGDGAKTVAARTGGGPNGAALGPDGKCTIANNGGFEWHREAGHIRPIMQAKDYSGGRIERVDLKTGAVECLYRACGEVPLKGPNDLVFDAHAGFISAISARCGRARWTAARSITQRPTAPSLPKSPTR